MDLFVPGRPRSTYYRDDGVVDILNEQHSNFMIDQELEAGYGFHNCSMKQFMAAHTGDPEWVITGLVPRGEVTLLAGEPGKGKSTLLLQMLISVATGRPFLGIPVETGRVVGLFHEDSVRTLRGRLETFFSDWMIDVDQLDASGHLMIEGRNSDPQSEDRRKLWSVTNRTENFEMLERKLKHVGSLKLLVLDTIAETMIGDKTLGEPVRHYISALQGLADRNNIAIIGSTHLDKNGETSGSAEFIRKGRSVIHLIDKKFCGLGLESVKSNCGPAAAFPPCLHENQRCLRTTISTVRSSPPINRMAKQTKGYPDLREVFIDAIDNTPEGLSVSKHARNYAPKFLYARWGKKLKATEAEFKALMDELFSEGHIGLKLKGSKHPTRILYVLDKV